MSDTPAGWYPDPGGQGGVRYFDGQGWTERVQPGPAPVDPQRSRRVPPWAWVVVAAVLVSLVLVLAVAIKAADRMPAMPDSHSPAPTAAAPARSQLIPELEFPTGTTRFGHPPYGPNEFWTVPLPYPETVNTLRRSLPVNRDYDGLPWCTEFDWRDELTIFSWGDTPDYLSVQVSPSVSDGEVSSQVSIGRAPHPSGCRR